MRVRIEEIAGLDETEIVIRCRERNEEVERVTNALGLFERNVSARKDGRTYRVPPTEVFYFESVDDRTWVNLRKEVLETSMRLYEIEEFLHGTTFVRVSRTTIVDAAKITSFRSSLNGRMEAKLANGESIEVSRTYVSALKMMLGGMSK
jgi:DNA-binding LytR/AlgR family response regulator